MTTSFWMSAGGGSVITLAGVLLGLLIKFIFDWVKWCAEKRQRQRDVIVPIIALKPRILDAFNKLMNDYQEYDLESPRRSPRLREQMFQSRAEWFVARDELAHAISVAMLVPLDDRIRTSLTDLSAASRGSPIVAHTKLGKAQKDYNELGNKLEAVETAAQAALAKVEPQKARETPDSCGT